MQFGFSVTVLAASPSSDWQQQHNDQIAQENQRHAQEIKQRPGENHQQWNNRQWRENQQHARWIRMDNERQYRNKLEMQRHEQELQRHQGENDQDWNERVYFENQQHNLNVQQIEVDLIAMFSNRDEYLNQHQDF